MTHAHSVHLCQAHGCMAVLTLNLRLQRITDLKVQTEKRRMRRSLAVISGTDIGQDRDHDAAEEQALATIQQA